MLQVGLLGGHAELAHVLERVRIRAVPHEQQFERGKMTVFHGDDLIVLRSVEDLAGIREIMDKFADGIADIAQMAGTPF